MTTPEPRRRRRAPSWLWTTTSGALVCRGILVLVLLAVWAIKFGGLREAGVVSNESVRWALGWLPSFLSGLGLPFIWPAFRTRLHRMAGFEHPRLRVLRRYDFLPECIVGAALLIAGEAFDGLFPQLGNTALQTFDTLDLVASVGGAAGAYALYHLLTAFPVPSELGSQRQP